jgi:trimethylamine:corrinoid methyltransferase-like protein
MEDHTVDHMMSEFFYPELSIRAHFDVWESRGRPDMLSRARERAAAILAGGGPVMDSDTIDRVKKAFPDIKETGISSFLP